MNQELAQISYFLCLVMVKDFIILSCAGLILNHEIKPGLELPLLD